MFCKKCGAELQDNTAFCTNCGNKVVATVAKTATVDLNQEVEAKAVQSQKVQSSEQHSAQNVNSEHATPNPYHPPKANKDTEKKNQKKGKKAAKVAIGVAAGVAVTGVAATAVVAGGIITYSVLTSPSNKVERLLDDKKYDEAYEVYSSSDKTEKLVSKISESLLRNLDSIKTDFVNKKITYEDAKSQLEDIKQFNFTDIEVQLTETSVYIETMQASFDAFTKGTEALSQENYFEAIAYLQRVIAEDPDYDTAVKSLEEAVSKYVKKALDEAEQFASKKDYTKALGALGDVMYEVKQLAKEEEYKLIEDKYNEYKTAFVAEVLKQVESEKENGNYDKAVSIIMEAMEIVSDESLNDALDAIEEAKPVKLEDLKLSESANYTQITDLDVTEDVVGNAYSPNNLFQISAKADNWGSGYEGYADYYLNYKYKRLTGTIAVADISDTTKATLTIYGDKEIIWTSGTVNRTTAPLDIDVDISNVDWLEFKLTTNEEAPNGTLSVLLSDLEFSKQ